MRGSRPTARQPPSWWLGALVGVPIGTYFLSRLDPVTTRWIISGFVFALLMLLLSGWRYRGKDHAAISVGIGGLSGFCSGLAQTGGPPIVGYWLGRPIASNDRARQHRAVFRRLGFLFPRQLFPHRIDHRWIRSNFPSWSGPSTALASGSAPRCSAAPARKVFRAICYALIAAAVIVGLPALDGVLRGR